MFYSAEFPEQVERDLFNLREIERNIIEPKLVFEGTSILSVDVARFGANRTVMTLVDKVDEAYFVRQIKAFEKLSTMETTGRVVDLIREFHFDETIVDATGLGSGVVDRLREQNFYVTELIAGSSPNDPEKFASVKAELYVQAKKLFEEDKLKIIREQRLIDELLAIETDYTSDGKLRIVDPPKSPDFADSLAYGLEAKLYESWDEPIY